MFPVESIHKITGEAIYMHATQEQISKLPDLSGKDICNDAGYVFMDLRELIYKIFNFPRPVLDYY